MTSVPASRETDPPAVPPRRTLLREYLEAIVMAIILALFFRTFLFQAFKIPSGSMLPTLQIGDHILVDKMIYSGPFGLFGVDLLPHRDPERGDIVVFKFPRNLHRDFIKRVIGLPGERVLVKGREVFVDGRLLDEPYASYVAGFPRSQRPRTFQVPEGQYLVLGDNRDNSQDGRYWGFLKRDLIKGRAFLVYWSWDATRGRPRTERLFHLLH